MDITTEITQAIDDSVREDRTVTVACADLDAAFTAAWVLDDGDGDYSYTDAPDEHYVVWGMREDGGHWKLRLDAAR